MIVCMMTPSMEHHQPPFWISEASWKAPPRVCFCVSFSKYCSLSLHFLMLCLLSGTSKATWSKMAQCREPAVAGALPAYIPRQDPANFPDLAKVPRDLLMKGFWSRACFFTFMLGSQEYCLKIYGHNSNRAHIWSHTCQLGGRMQQAWTRVYHFQQPDHCYNIAQWLSCPGIDSHCASFCTWGKKGCKINCMKPGFYFSFM